MHCSVDDERTKEEPLYEQSLPGRDTSSGRTNNCPQEYNRTENVSNIESLQHKCHGIKPDQHSKIEN
jgi:hypothetical protein